ncbi:MAG: NAD(P)H-binding protein [Nitrospirota bacterium]|jgi:uncharacterized protein YbjT (DUF2867 family)
MDGNKEAGHRALVLGATGFLGRRLLPELLSRGIPVRAMVRQPGKIEPGLRERMEVVQGDALDEEDLARALTGMTAAFYLIHSMGGRSIGRGRVYAETDRRIAETFMRAARRTGLGRVIYVGALGETGPGLSEHLRSRAEVARILSSGGPRATVLRAAIVIGAGGASFEMLRYLTERLPVMVCPKWIDTRIQPIAVRDVLEYMIGCLLAPETAGESFDVCGPEVLTYREMIQQYAAARGLARRVIFRVPLLTPLLSAYWVDLVTPVASGIAHPLIEGLKSEVVCRDSRIDKYVPVKKTPFHEAVRIAFSEETSGPGVTGF